MPIPPQELALYFGPAIASSLLLSLVAWRAWSKSSPAKGYWAPPLAIGLGFAAATLAMLKWKSPGLPPTLAENWLFWAALVVAVVGLLEALLPICGEIRGWHVVVLTSATLFLVLRPLLRNSWKAEFAVLAIGGTVIVAMALWFLIERTSERHPGALPPLILTLTATSLSAYIGLANSLDLSLRAGAVAATLGPISAVALWRPRVSLMRGGALAYVVLTAGLLAAQYGYTPEPAPGRLVTLACLPLVSLGLLWLPLTGWKRWVAALGPQVATVVVILILAFKDFQAAQSSAPW